MIKWNGKPTTRIAAKGSGSGKRQSRVCRAAEAPCDTCSYWGAIGGLFSGMLLLGASMAGVARAAPGRGDRAVDRAGLAAIRGYRRWLSHRLPTQCRFTPTCSAYGLAAVERYGLAVGGRLAAARLSRCLPTVPHGTPDPVG